MKSNKPLYGVTMKSHDKNIIEIANLDQRLENKLYLIEAEPLNTRCPSVSTIDIFK